MVVMEENISHSPVFADYALYFLLSIISILTLYHFWFQSLRYVKLGIKLPDSPGVPSLPLIGATYLFFNKNPFEVLKFAYEQLQWKTKIMKGWLGNRLVVALLDPRDIELILGSNVHLEKSLEYSFLEPWLGDGLLISKGEKWRSHRKMIAPTFHQSILRTFVPTFNKNANELIEKLRKEVLGEIFDIHDYMGGTTVDNLLETVMGVKIPSVHETSSKYAKAAMKMTHIVHLRHYKPWFHLNILFRMTTKYFAQKHYLRIIHSLVDKVIKQKKSDYLQGVQGGDAKETEIEEVQEVQKGNFGLNFESGLRDDLDENDESVGGKKKLPFLECMMEASQKNGVKWSDQDIRDEVNTIMLEGHDTIAPVSCFFLCLLGVHQDIQEKVYQELNSIFQGTNRAVTFNDTLEMKYLERVLLETLRLYPPVPIIARTVNKDIQLASADYLVPSGTTFAICSYAIHRNPDQYPNPEKFNPDNFLPENCQKRHYYSFLPFSAGPRSCVGRKYAILNMKILLASLVRTFKIKSVVDEKDFQLYSDLSLKRADGFRIILEERINH